MARAVLVLEDDFGTLEVHCRELERQLTELRAAAEPFADLVRAGAVTPDMASKTPLRITVTAGELRHLAAKAMGRSG